MTSLWLDRTGSITPRASASPDLPDASDVVVVGAGITGLTTALMLARAGRRVTVLEARYIGAGATGNTTAKASLLQGSVLSGISKHRTDSVLRAYVEGNRLAQLWLRDYLTERDVDFQDCTAYTYAVTARGARAVEKEREACLAGGLLVEDGADPGLPYPVEAAIALPHQIQFDPMEVLRALAEDVSAAGGRIFEGVRVEGAGSGAPLTVHTSGGEITTDQLILATGAPILDRGLYFAKLAPERSYALSFSVPGELPEGMYLSVDDPARSVRTAPDGDRTLLLVGGNGHTVGRHSSPRSLVEDLVGWTQQHWPGAELTHSWSAQDYQSMNHVPFVGPLPRSGGAIQVATGFNKWGMTNGVAAALNLSQTLTAEKPEWAKQLLHRLTGPRDLAEGALTNASVGLSMTKGWAGAALSGLPEDPPAEGEGVVGRDLPTPTAVSTVDGQTCAVSAVCPHLGGIVTWNDAERSWDCPLHGSRFAADGTLLEGPATSDLTRRTTSS